MKQKKNSGKSYTTYKGIQVPEKLPCTENRLCREKCRLKCNERFCQETRIRLFEEYYSLEANEKNSYLFGILEPEIKYLPEDQHPNEMKGVAMKTDLTKLLKNSEIL